MGGSGRGGGLGVAVGGRSEGPTDGANGAAQKDQRAQHLLVEA